MADKQQPTVTELWTFRDCSLFSGGVAKVGKTTFPCTQQGENLSQSLVLVEFFTLPELS